MLKPRVIQFIFLQLRKNNGLLFCISYLYLLVCVFIRSSYRTMSGIRLLKIIRKHLMSILHHSTFFTTVNHIKDLPKALYPEIAFAGRSNAGKSSAINVLCNQKRLAFSSNTPGRTQHINYFTVGRRGETYGYLVDLPGYGYAKTPLEVKNHWNELLGIYMQERDQLKGMILMCDIRRGFTDLDVEMINWFSPLAKPIHVLLTKCDKLSRNQAKQTLFAVEKQLKMMAGEWGTVQLFSSTERIGLEEATEVISSWIEKNRVPQVPSAE